VVKHLSRSRVSADRDGGEADEVGFERRCDKVSFLHSCVEYCSLCRDCRAVKRQLTVFDLTFSSWSACRNAMHNQIEQE
jgi:hypothetical protein